MYQLEINNLVNLDVKSKKFTYEYATDGSKQNPLEATYGALTGCAGVYALKACKKLQVSPLGMKISCAPMIDKNNPVMLTKWTTNVQFPDGFTSVQKAAVLESIQHCAVKDMIAQGSSIEFVTVEV